MIKHAVEIFSGKYSFYMAAKYIGTREIDIAIFKQFRLFSDYKYVTYVQNLTGSFLAM